MNRFQETIDFASSDTQGTAEDSSHFQVEVDAEFPTSTNGIIHERFTDHWHLEGSLTACAACGVRQVIVDPSTSAVKKLSELAVLRYDPEQIAKLHRVPEDYRKVIGHYGHGDDYYHIHQHLVHFPDGSPEPHAQVCANCWKEAQYDQIPKYSIRNGVDFGCGLRLQLPTLRLVEKYLIACSILFILLIKLPGTVS